MRFAQVAFFGSLALAAQALAQSPPAAPAKALPTTPAEIIFIAGKSAPALPMAEWDVAQKAAGEQTGVRVLIAEGQGAVDKAPAGASKYEARAYKFPEGSIRILTWKKAAGPVIHQITFETQIMVLQGSADVAVSGRTVNLKAGDAVFLPSGVLRNMKPREDTVIAQYFVASTAKNPKSAVVRGKELKESTIVQWIEDGKPMTARTTEEIAKAPADAGTYTVKRYGFDGNSIRLAKLRKGGRTGPATYKVDVLIYITRGRMRRIEGDQSFEVVAGDAVREVKGQSGYWELLEDSEFIATDAPFDPTMARANP